MSDETSGQGTGEPGEDELVASNPNANGPDGAAGGMGVSSEIEGSTGPGQHGTDGQLDTSPGPTPSEASETSEKVGEDDTADVQPQSPGPPKSGYNSRDPRSKESAFEPGPQQQRELREDG